jgi:hypothetical protein
MAERLAAGASAEVLALNVVASIAVSVVVMDTRQDRVPRATLSHFLGSF